MNTPSEPLLKWVIDNPDSVIEAFAIVKKLREAKLQIVAPSGPTTSGGTALIESAANIIIPVPIKFASGIANSTATAASVSAQLNLLLAALRRNGQLPT